MATLFCKWPANDKAGADAYAAQCAIDYGLLSGEENAIWAISRADQNGNWTVPLLGPPWCYVIPGDFEESASCLALRGDAVVVATPEWPDEEE